MATMRKETARMVVAARATSDARDGWCPCANAKGANGTAAWEIVEDLLFNAEDGVLKLAIRTLGRSEAARTYCTAYHGGA